MNNFFKLIFFWIIIFSEAVVFAQTPVIVGSKKFTESVVLGEVARQMLIQNNVPAKHIAEFGGTSILWNALLAGNIDVYPEYTSTIEEELLKHKHKNFAELQASLAKMGIGASPKLGFNNTYALGMKKTRAAGLGISKISDLARFPDLKLGWSEEFLQRRDGWPGLKEKYGLSQPQVRGIDHDVAYRALQTEDIDLMDLYSTDAEIRYYDLLILQDDLNYFPRYEALYLYRLATAEHKPKLPEILSQFAGKIGEAAMISMNHKAKVDKVASEEVAAAFLLETFSVITNQKAVGRGERLLARTKEHLKLVLFSLFFAILIAVPLGIIAEKKQGLGRLILWVTGGIQTIPSLALLVILIKPLNVIGLTGIGDTPAFIALFLYSLLPIVRGAHIGFQQIPLALRETAEVIGLSFKARLFRIELPLALPTILSGIKTAAVMNVGFATLGALVGAGGFGQPILTGIRLDDYGLILEGALPSAILALAVQQLFDFSEKFLVSPGLRK